MTRSMNIAVIAFGLFGVLPACSKTEQPKPEISEPARAPNIDKRDQYALVEALDAIVDAPANERGRRYAEIKSDWQGRRFRWELRLLPALCSRADACFAVAFDHARSNQRIVQGWLPRLEIDAATHEKIKKSCESHAACVIEVEAKLTRLVVSSDLPTSVTLGDLTAVNARSEKPNESWGRARAETVSKR